MTSTQFSSVSNARAKRDIFRAALLAACVTIYSAQPAWAQDQPDQKADAPDSDIVVTGTRAQSGTKTDTKLTEIPQSISIVSAKEFTARSVVDFQDAFRYSAGVTTETTGQDVRSDGFSARGFDTVLYLDGLNRNPSSLYGARVEPFTLSRAEVLRGPSSVLYGAGGSGGLLNAISKVPEQTPGAEFQAVLGNNAHKEVRADATGPISDTLSARLVMLYRDADMQWRYSKEKRLLLMPELSWRPDADTNVTLIGEFVQDRNGTQTYQPAAFGPNGTATKKAPFDFFYGEPDFNHMRSTYKAATLIVERSFGEHVKFSSHTRYYTQSVDYAEVWPDGTFADAADTIANRQFYVLNATYKSVNSDNNAELKFKTGAFEHTMLFGVDYTWFHKDHAEGFSCAGITGANPYACYEGGSPPPIDIANPNYGQSFSYGFTNAYTNSSTQLGFYAQDQIRYADRVSLVLGVRHDHETSSLSGATLPSNSATTFRAGIIGDLVKGVSPYFSYSESFLPVFGADVYGRAFKPRQGRQFEGGVKWQPNKYSLITVAYFDIKESNVTVQDPANIQNFIQSGQVGSKGVEVEGNFRVAGFNITASYSHVDAKTLVDTTGMAGHRVAGVPRDLASGWIERPFNLTPDVKATLGGGARYTGNKLDGFDVIGTPSVTLFDAMASLEYQNWKLSLSGSNLGNKQYWAYCTGGICYQGANRKIFATLGFHY